MQVIRRLGFLHAARVARTPGAAARSQARARRGAAGSQCDYRFLPREGTRGEPTFDLPSPREPRWRHPTGSDSVGGRLTSREWEVVELLAQGHSTAEIAQQLVLSASAVRVHIASVVRKLNVPDRAAAAELFRRSGT
jgi:DNA-binding NarL/FixJ family response regulator